MTLTRWLVVLALLGATVVAGGWLALSLALGTTSGGCPTALLQGTLVELDGSLAVRGPDGGPPAAVSWPFGYAVERRDGQLVLTRLFQVVAREGDVVGVGGGYLGTDDVFVGCGAVTMGWVIPPRPANHPIPEPTAVPTSTFVVVASVSRPCIPPPSGCGYRVTLTPSSGEASQASLEDRRTYEDVGKGTKAALQLEAGLPTTLVPGSYTITFDMAVYTDIISFDANGNEIGPLPGGSCSAVVTVPDPADDHPVTVRVAFDNQACTIEPSTFVEPGP